MTDDEFDAALVTAAFALAGEEGWRGVSVAGAARRAGLKLDRARGRFASTAAVLDRFGRMADQAALAGADAEAGAPARDRLFDMLMRRLDVLQAHRDGVLALLRALPADPLTAAMLAGATTRSMGWMLEGAGLPASGLRGMLRAEGLVVVWLMAVRAWRDDASADLSATMSALDSALRRAEQAEDWFGGLGRAPAEEPPAPEVAEAPAATPHVVTAESLPHTAPPPPDVAF